jgi:hypothetical protein
MGKIVPHHLDGFHGRDNFAPSGGGGGGGIGVEWGQFDKSSNLLKALL